MSAGASRPAWWSSTTRPTAASTAINPQPRRAPRFRHRGRSPDGNAELSAVGHESLRHGGASRLGHGNLQPHLERSITHTSAPALDTRHRPVCGMTGPLGAPLPWMFIQAGRPYLRRSRHRRTAGSRRLTFRAREYRPLCAVEWLLGDHSLRHLELSALRTVCSALLIRQGAAVKADQRNIVIFIVSGVR